MMLITNASTKSLSQVSSSPNMGSALDGWYQKIDIYIIAKTVVDFQLSEALIKKPYMAVRQPFTSRQLEIKPEGQRAWGWQTLHIRGDSAFNMDDIITINGTQYRVMQRFEWADYGYTEYQIIESFTNGPLPLTLAVSESAGTSELLGLSP